MAGSFPEGYFLRSESSLSLLAAGTLSLLVFFCLSKLLLRRDPREGKS